MSRLLNCRGVVAVAPATALKTTSGRESVSVEVPGTAVVPMSGWWRGTSGGDW